MLKIFNAFRYLYYKGILKSHAPETVHKINKHTIVNILQYRLQFKNNNTISHTCHIYLHPESDLTSCKRVYYENCLHWLYKQTSIFPNTLEQLYSTVIES